MRIKTGYIMKELGKESIAIAIGEEGKKFHGVINLNPMGAWIWKRLEEGITKKQLMERILAEVEDCPAEETEKDVNEFIESISFAIDFENEQ